jgi:predicted ATP-grasp superfamily ATP-dependent carboligase
MTVLFLDPLSEYAESFFDRVQRRFGTSVVGMHVDRAQWFQLHRRFQSLREQLIFEYFVDPRQLKSFAEHVKQAHQISGIIPWSEYGVRWASEMLDELGIDWLTSDTLRLFGNKHALKQRLRQASVPTNETRPVQGPSDIWDHPSGAPERFVLKPIDGVANQAVGFFDRDSGREQVAAFMARAELDGVKPAFMLEDFLEGAEYMVNGQTDETGAVHVFSIFRYDRTEANGRQNLYHHTWLIPRSDPTFAPLAAYAKQVVAATGLKRCPFHMEVIYTPQGPRLVEVGARPVGSTYMYNTMDAHGGKLDVFDIAAHHYLSDASYGPYGENWEHYDRTQQVGLCGVSREHDVIYQLSGVEEIEALPQFVRWAAKPEFGQRLEPTDSVYNRPYSVILSSTEPGFDLKALADQVEHTIRWNERVPQARRLVWQMSRVQRKLRWTWFRARLLRRGHAPYVPVASVVG